MEVAAEAVSGCVAVVPSATPALFRRLLRHLPRFPPSQGVVVANTDDAEARAGLVAAADEVGWRSIDAGRNLGFAGACNVAAAMAPGSDVVLLNDDLRPREGMVERMLATLRKEPRAAAVGGRLFRSSGSVEHAGAMQRKKGWLHLRGGNDCVWVEGLTFAAVALRRECWDELGGLNEDYWYGGEDQDYCLRALALNWGLVCDSRACGVHDPGTTRGTNFRRDETVARLVAMWPWERIEPIVVGYRERSRLWGRPGKGENMDVNTLGDLTWSRRELNGLVGGFVGRGIDVGCGAPQPTWWKRYPAIASMHPWDRKLGHKDAELLEGVPDGEYDFLFASHILEHVINPERALRNWLRVVRPGGHLLVVVPHRDLYEGKPRLPSRWNPNHLRFYLPHHSDNPDTVNLHQWLLDQRPGFRLAALQTGDWGSIRAVPPKSHASGEFHVDALLVKDG